MFVEQASLPAVDLTSLNQEQLQSMVTSLQEALELQQKEVARAVQEASSMQQVMQALQVSTFLLRGNEVAAFPPEVSPSIAFGPCRF